MLRCHWRYHDVITKVSGSSYVELADPIIFYDASRTNTLLPIPMICCESPPVSPQRN
jgi:hypothetical protein